MTGDPTVGDSGTVHKFPSTSMMTLLKSIPEDGFTKLNVPLENTDGATLIFRADIVDDIPVISVF